MREKRKRVWPFFILLIFIGEAKEVRAEKWQAGLQIGIVPYRMDEARYGILTNEYADRSPVKSIIALDQPETTLVFALAGVGRYKFLDSPQANLLGVGEISISAWNHPLFAYGLGLGIELERQIGKSEKTFLTGGLMLNSLMVEGKIGEVGERPGDYYLLAPDNHEYYTGSEIKVKKISFGTKVYGGIQYLLSTYRIFVKLGYQYIPTIDDWEYEIIDKDDKSIKCKLPAKGFEKQPSPLKPSGVFLMIGITYLF